MFSDPQHKTRFDSLRMSNWYDPNTRDEIFICDIIIYYGKTHPNNNTLKHVLELVPITNNIYRCLRELETNQTIVTECLKKISNSRMTELMNLV